MDSDESLRQMSEWYGISKESVLVIPFSPNPKIINNKIKVKKSGTKNLYCRPIFAHKAQANHRIALRISNDLPLELRVHFVARTD